MAHVDSAVVTPGTGFVFLGDPGTVRPSPALIASYVPMDDDHFPGYNALGHTSRDELPQFGQEGGTTETQGTWSNASFREVVTETAADYVTFNPLQYDASVLELYTGQVGGMTVDGVFEVQNSATTTINKALLIVIVDGPRRVSFHSANASIRREDSVELNTDEFTRFPLRATFLKVPGQALYSFGGVVAEDEES